MNRRFLLLALVVVTLSIGSLTYALVDARGHTADNTAAIRSACVQVQKLERVIQSVLRQSLHTLGLRGTAGYSYYRVHLPELAAARLAIEQEIAEFSTRHC